MSVDSVKTKPPRHQVDTTWDYLIATAKDQIAEAEVRISQLAKAIVFFQKKKTAGERFPVSVKLKS